MRLFCCLLALVGCVEPERSGERWPGSEAHRPGPPGDLSIAGPAIVEPGATYTWTISGPAIAPFGRVDFGWGGDVSGGPCPSPAGGVCLDIANPARRLSILTADAAGGTVEVTATVPGTNRDEIVLQALAVDGAASEKSEPFPLQIVRNTCVPTFTPVTLAGGGTNVQGGGFVDVDADGNLDVFLPSGGLFMGDGAGGFTEESAARGIVLGGSGIHGFAPGDVDGDGDIDLFVPGDNRKSAIDNQLYINDGTGHFTDQASTWGLLMTTTTPGATVWTDHDQDGDLDLFYGSEFNTHGVFRNDGAPPLVNAVNTDFSTHVQGETVLWANFDADPELEAFQGRANGGHRYWNHDGSQWVDEGPTAGVHSVGSRFGGATALDMNGDGLLDVHMVVNNAADVGFFNDGDSTFTSFNPASLGLPAGTHLGSGAAWADADLDGDLDVILAADRRIHLNDGNFNFSVAPVTIEPSSVAVTWADVNHDQRPDLLVGRIFAPPLVYINESGCASASFELEVTRDGHIATGAVVHIDMDGNGDFSPAGELRTFAWNQLSAETTPAGPAMVFGLGGFAGVDVRVVDEGIHVDRLDVLPGQTITIDL